MIDQFPERFCRNVRAIRLHHGLSISQMADILELSDNLLILLESGIVTDEMDIRILEHIFFHFGIYPNQLLTETLFE